MQEICDLVRYTPAPVNLKGNFIAQKLELEKWDEENEVTWYRLRENDAISIYNMGVLVRHDPDNN
ncbi:hypothetical protein [Pantoea allii]|uniref:hypothetical protein n=1 Tax=Pantoea allii TaxID=574096 RepID=UPI000A256098|nr:hypothetical protein [Pantoea allii]MBW1252272.1 hypothetical protein [Pantoea allii]MBW1261551.1 hypothetical protein [Pantoea allii]MBW1283789.1 hypothetical protein [Pantoea allii]ORM86696.1 hypothetical protein HA38_08010 [Pantoea allii]